MKLFYLVFLLSFCTLVKGQEIKQLPKNVSGQIEFSEIVSIDSLISTQLYSNSKMFVRSTFASAKDIGQIKDEKTLSITTKGSFPVSVEISNGSYLKAKVIFTFSIQNRDRKYKYTISNFYFGFSDDNGITTHASFDDLRGVNMSKKQWMDVQEQTHDFMTYFIEELKEKMHTAHMMHYSK